MAFADWDITGLNAQVDNTLLPNPLPQPWAGQYCREIGAVGNEATILLNAGYQGGAFVGTSYNKVIRLRGCIRRATNTGGYVGGLTARFVAINGVRGYNLIYDAYWQSITLRVNNMQEYLLSPLVGNVFAPDWFSMEMIIYPMGGVGDRIVVSQEVVPGSGNYTQLSINGGVPAEGIFFNNLQAEYAPISGASRVGIAAPCTTGNAAGYIYMDKVNIALSDAP